MTATVPPTPPGVADVQVTASGGTSAIVAADHYTYNTTTCTFNTLPVNSIINVTPGVTAINSVCSGLNPSQTLLPAYASPLAGVLQPFSIGAATTLLPAGFPVSATPDSSGNLNLTRTVPSQTQGTDPDAQCPPTQDQVNRGLLFCAYAIADINGVNYANVLLQYPGQHTPANPTLGLGPTTGPSGTSVTVSGESWWGGGITDYPVPASAITVGGTPATVSTVHVAAPIYAINNTNTGGVLTGGTISGSFTIPSGAPGGSQTVAIDQANPGGFPGNGPGNTVEGTAPFNVTVAAPTVTSVTPNNGSTAGGTSVSIVGTNLTGANTVSFGGTAAASFTPVDSTHVNATSPAHASGTIDVTVSTPGGGTSGIVAARPLHLNAPPLPAVTSVTPNNGSTLGGTVVSIVGTNLTGTSAVSFGGTAATTFTPVDATHVTATSPAHASGTIDVTVTTGAGTSGIVAGDHFTFNAPPPLPTVTSVSPTSGSTAGGTSVTITGTGLTGASAVSFGGTAAASFTPVSATSVTATSPAHASGTVDITVTTPGGTSGINIGDQFTFNTPPPLPTVSA